LRAERSSSIWLECIIKTLSKRCITDSARHACSTDSAPRAAAEMITQMRRLLLLVAAAYAKRGGDFTGVNFGIRGADFVLLAAETGHRKGPLQYTADGGGAIRRVADGAVLSCVGHPGEADDLAAFLRESLTAYRLDAGRLCPAKATSHFLRREIADRRREGAAPELRALLGTVSDEGAALTWVDESGARADLPYGAHGVGAPLVLGLLDEAYSASLNRDEAVELARTCLDVLRRRYALAVDAARIVILDAESCREVT